MQMYDGEHYLNLFLGHINAIGEVAPLDIVRLPLESKHVLEGASLLLICAFASPYSRRVERGVEAIVLWAVGVHATEGGGEPSSQMLRGQDG